MSNNSRFEGRPESRDERAKGAAEGADEGGEGEEGGDEGNVKGEDKGGDKGDGGSGGGGGADGTSFGHRQPEQSHPYSVTRAAHVQLAPRHADGTVAHSSQLRPWQVAGQLPGGSGGCEGGRSERKHDSS